MSLGLQYLSFLDHFSVQVAAVEAGHPDHGRLPMAEAHPGVDPRDEEAFAPAASEGPEVRLQSDVELELHLPGKGGLGPGHGGVGVGEVDGGLDEHAHHGGRLLLRASPLHAPQGERKVLTVRPRARMCCLVSSLRRRRWSSSPEKSGGTRPWRQMRSAGGRSRGGCS